MEFQHHSSMLALYFEFKETCWCFCQLIKKFNKEAVSMTVNVSYWVLIMLRRVLTLVFFEERAVFWKNL